jgi:hypothetical protein
MNEKEQFFFNDVPKNGDVFFYQAAIKKPSFINEGFFFICKRAC